MRIVFMGTPEFAVPSLKALSDAGYEIVGVFTQPDRPSGRGNRIRMSPVKQFALEKGIPVFQPVKIRLESVDTLRELAPDLCVTAAFGQILSQAILDIPRLGTVNVHASLLPKHRGSAPIAWAILEGDTQIGVTTMVTERGIDTGDMLMSASMPLDPDRTCGEWTEILSQTGAELLIRTIQAMEKGDCPRTPQNEADMSYDPMLTKEMGLLSFAESNVRVRNRIHALNPWPCCSVALDGGRLKILRAQLAEGGGQPGEVLAADPGHGLIVACAQGAVRLLEIQSPGGKAMRAEDWLRGHHVETGSIWGEEHE